MKGCDITSKISTKLSALNTIRKPDDACFIINFDCPPPKTDSAIELAELFLVKCLKPSTDLETFEIEICLTTFDSNYLKLDLEETYSKELLPNATMNSSPI